MGRLGSWIEPFPEGIFVKPANAWVDPSQPKDKALVTAEAGGPSVSMVEAEEGL